MAEESSARTQAWLRTGCNAFDTEKPISKPMSFWTEQDVLQYIKRYNLPYASVYGDIVEDEKTGLLKTTGALRTGCMFCMFGCHLEKEPNRFQKMKQTHPKIWEYCMKPLDNGGLGLKEVLEYIDVKYE
jgi:3'-phosphoadenosine 5'-phosphosulfate sulfotransferase (PAPS reductase)/FAD synthetase